MKTPKPEETEASNVQEISPEIANIALAPSSAKQTEIVSEETSAVSNRKKKSATPEEIERRQQCWDENCRIFQAWAKEKGLTEDYVFELIKRVRREEDVETGSD